MLRNPWSCALICHTIPAPDWPRQRWYCIEPSQTWLGCTTHGLWNRALDKINICNLKSCWGSLNRPPDVIKDKHSLHVPGVATAMSVSYNDHQNNKTDFHTSPRQKQLISHCNNDKFVLHTLTKITYQVHVPVLQKLQHPQVILPSPPKKK